jgi:hypothetical protein
MVPDGFCLSTRVINDSLPSDGPPVHRTDSSLPSTASVIAPLERYLWDDQKHETRALAMFDSTDKTGEKRIETIRQMEYPPSSVQGEPPEAISVYEGFTAPALEIAAHADNGMSRGEDQKNHGVSVSRYLREMQWHDALFMKLVQQDLQLPETDEAPNEAAVQNAPIEDSTGLNKPESASTPGTISSSSIHLSLEDPEVTRNQHQIYTDFNKILAENGIDPRTEDGEPTARYPPRRCVLLEDLVPKPLANCSSPTTNDPNWRRLERRLRVRPDRKRKRSEA